MPHGNFVRARFDSRRRSLVPWKSTAAAAAAAPLTYRLALS